MELGSNYDLDITKLGNTNNNVQTYLNDFANVYADSGRSAIRLLLRGHNKGKVLLPSYICKSVVDCFDIGWDIQYYILNERLEASIDEIKKLLDTSVSIVYVMHYFGIPQNGEFLDYIVKKQKEFGYIILEDTTHSFLTNQKKIGDYAVCSLRKWFPIPDGGVLYSDKAHTYWRGLVPNKLSAFVTEAMLMKYLYLKLGIECNHRYRNIFSQAERELDERREIYGISELSTILLECYDIKKMANSRIDNWNYIQENLRSSNVIPMYGSMAEDFVPFAFPVMVKDRDNFRKYMIENKIYCAVHWPMETEEQQQIEMNKRIGQHIISLPIDQRYSIEEMQYMVKIIEEYDTMVE